MEKIQHAGERQAFQRIRSAPGDSLCDVVLLAVADSASSMQCCSPRVTRDSPLMTKATAPASPQGPQLDRCLPLSQEKKDYSDNPTAANEVPHPCRSSPSFSCHSHVLHARSRSFHDKHLLQKTGSTQQSMMEKSGDTPLTACCLCMSRWGRPLPSQPLQSPLGASPSNQLHVRGCQSYRSGNMQRRGGALHIPQCPSP